MPINGYQDPNEIYVINPGGVPKVMPKCQFDEWLRQRDIAKNGNPAKGGQGKNLTMFNYLNRKINDYQLISRDEYLKLVGKPQPKVEVAEKVEVKSKSKTKKKTRKR